MKILLSLLFLSFYSCTNAQGPGSPKATGYVTYAELRKAFSGAGIVKYDSINGIFSAPVNMSAYSNDANFITTAQAKNLFAPVTHTHSIAQVTGLKDSMAALNSKIAFLMSRIDSIKATTFIDTTHMYIIVHTIKDSTQLPK